MSDLTKSAREALDRFDAAPPSSAAYLGAAIECVGMLRLLVERREEKAEIDKAKAESRRVLYESIQAAAERESKRQGQWTMWKIDWPGWQGSRE